MLTKGELKPTVVNEPIALEVLFQASVAANSKLIISGRPDSEPIGQERLEDQPQLAVVEHVDPLVAHRIFKVKADESPLEYLRLVKKRKQKTSHDLCDSARIRAVLGAWPLFPFWNVHHLHRSLPERIRVLEQLLHQSPLLFQLFLGLFESLVGLGQLPAEAIKL